jgi:NADH:ubiquinone oxidoreductase subunit
MHLGTKIFTLLCGALVGSDGYGNRYFTEKRPSKSGRQPRRWMLFAGQPEASKVPPEWHAWLHHNAEQPPASPQKPGGRQPASWQKPHHPNLTGTKWAWRPRGHVLRGGQRPKAIGDYEPWQPEA